MKIHTQDLLMTAGELAEGQVQQKRELRIKKLAKRAVKMLTGKIVNGEEIYTVHPETVFCR